MSNLNKKREKPMNRLSIEARAVHDGRLRAFLDRFERRVAATPPGMCPVAVTATLLETSAAQTCGKCVQD